MGRATGAGEAGRARRGGCPSCGTRIREREVLADGMIHPRSTLAGGPFHTILCPGCQTRLAGERSGAEFVFTDERSLPRSSPMRRALRFFLGMPKRWRGRGAKNEDRARIGGPASDDGTTSGGGAAGGAGGGSSRSARPAGARAGAGSGASRRQPPGARFKAELALLGLPLDASLEDVRRRFRELAKQLHPDRVPASAPAEERSRASRRFVAVKDAYKAIVASWPQEDST